MKKLKGSWTSVAAITALLCFILGVCFKPLNSGIDDHFAKEQVKSIDRAYRFNQLRAPSVVYPKSK
jgi:hypothetical protein